MGIAAYQAQITALIGEIAFVSLQMDDQIQQKSALQQESTNLSSQEIALTSAQQGEVVWIQMDNPTQLGNPEEQGDRVLIAGATPGSQAVAMADPASVNRFGASPSGAGFVSIRRAPAVAGQPQGPETVAFNFRPAANANGVTVFGGMQVPPGQLFQRDIAGQPVVAQSGNCVGMKKEDAQRMIKQRQGQLKQKEMLLDKSSEQFKNRLNFLEKHLDSVRQLLDKALNRFFKGMGGGGQ